MTERILDCREKAYKNMKAVASMLEAVSESGYRYDVENVYLDFGQDWKWTTICEYGGMMSCQVLTPRDWKRIVSAETLDELVEIVKHISADI